MNNGKENIDWRFDFGIPEHLWIRGIRVNDGVPTMDVTSLICGKFSLKCTCRDVIIVFKSKIEWSSLLRVDDIICLTMSCNGWDDWEEKYKITNISKHRINNG